jgi:hypothetical protein
VTPGAWPGQCPAAERKGGSVQGERPAGAWTQRRRRGVLLRPAGADCAAQCKVGARKAALIRLVSQHLEALHEADGRGIAIACGRLVVAHSGVILEGNHLTGL